MTIKNWEEASCGPMAKRQKTDADVKQDTKDVKDDRPSDEMLGIIMAATRLPDLNIVEPKDISEIMPEPEPISDSELPPRPEKKKKHKKSKSRKEEKKTGDDEESETRDKQSSSAKSGSNT